MKNLFVKHLLLILVIINFFSLSVVTNAQNNYGEPGGKMFLFSRLDSVSFAIGFLVGTNNKQQLVSAPSGDKINVELMSAAFRLASFGEKNIMTKDEANKIVRSFFETGGKNKARENLEAGNLFLEQNKLRWGVKTTDSGLQYEVIKMGYGLNPLVNDKVRVHYHGTLIDGTIFDSSVDRGESVVFGVRQVISGWTEALLLMQEGAKWKIYLPANLAYGERGAGGNIKPNSVLIFEVELLDVIKE